MTTSLTTEYAIRAWTRRHSGAWTEDDELQLRAWLSAAPENQSAYNKVARVWADTGALAGRFDRPPGPIVAEPSSSRGRAVAIACAVAVMSVIAGYVGLQSWNGQPQYLNAARDKPQAIVLEDGTRVVLDAGSQLVVRLGWLRRTVSLRRGEALFTVTHDGSRPFEVESGAGKVLDVGTRFDLENVGGSTRIAVLEGRVEVLTRQGSVGLTAGQSGGYDRDGMLLAVGKADSSVTLWAGGRRRFEAEPLPDVLERLARYHNVSFVFSDPRVKALHVSGTFRVDDLPLFLSTLAAALPLQTRQIGPDRIEISPSGAR